MKSFLQSDEWAKFQNSIGRETLKIDGIYIVKHNLPFGESYLYAPRLRPSDFGGQARLENFLSEVKKIAKQRNAIFFKIELESLDFARDNSCELEKFGFIKSNNIQPLQTIILDLEKSEEELLSQMHQKTRYNIKLAEKQAKIQITKSKFQNSDKNFDEFWKLMQETTKRDGFHSYSKEYYRKLLEIPGAELFIASHNNNTIAANIVLFYENQAIYLHGASSYEHRNLMAAPLLQWHQILEAKKIGCTEYDLWGIDEIKWPGVTRFKRGFCPNACKASSDPNSKSCRGGKEITYPGAYDLVFKPFWYGIYKIAKKIL